MHQRWYFLTRDLQILRSVSSILSLPQSGKDTRLLSINITSTVLGHPQRWRSPLRDGADAIQLSRRTSDEASLDDNRRSTPKLPRCQGTCIALYLVFPNIEYDNRSYFHNMWHYDADCSADWASQTKPCTGLLEVQD